MDEMCIDMLRQKKILKYHTQEALRILFRGLAIAAVVLATYFICTSGSLIASSLLFIKQQMHHLKL